MVCVVGSRPGRGKAARETVRLRLTRLARAWFACYSRMSSEAGSVLVPGRPRRKDLGSPIPRILMEEAGWHEYLAHHPDHRRGGAAGRWGLGDHQTTEVAVISPPGGATPQRGAVFFV